MIGGAGVLAGRHASQSQSRESDQEQRIEQLESDQQAPPPPPAPPPPAAAPAGDDLVSKLKELSQMVDSGALTKDEFEVAKQKLLS
jgi:TolA-binding protein